MTRDITVRDDARHDIADSATRCTTVGLHDGEKTSMPRAPALSTLPAEDPVQPGESFLET